MTAVFVPGRLEVLGKHTDYAGGRSLLAAVDRGVTVRVLDGTDGVSARTTASDDGLTVHPGRALGLPAGHWGWYLQAVIDRLGLNFGELRPAHLEIDSNLPLASGMSSSSALVVGMGIALAEYNGFTQTDLWRDNIRNQIDLAGYLATMENGMSFGTLKGVRGVGTFGGSEDHTAMLCCRADHLTQFSFCPIVEHESVAFRSEWTFVVAVSGVLAEKTGAALALYNQASLLTTQIVSAWNQATGRSDVTVGDVLAQGEEAVERLKAVVAPDPALATRLEAFLTESEELIPAATAAVAAGDLAEFGRLADRSQASADAKLRNQVPETNRLQQLARELGAEAACGFGAGFGGSVWALTRSDAGQDFADAWLETYVREYPGVLGRARTLVTRPGPPARRL